MIEVVWADIDGTLAEVEHRRHHIRNGKKDWISFLSAADKDPIIEPVAKTIRYLAKSVPIICCTGRGEEYRALTENWLYDHNIPYTKLYMRSVGDTRADHVVKLELLHQMRNDGYEPFIAIDDRHSVCIALRQAGITVLQCSDWDETKAQAGVRLDVLCGPTKAGKSFYAGLHYPPQHVLSFNQIKTDISNFSDERREDDITAAIRNISRTRLSHGIPTTIDSCNIKRKERVQSAMVGIPNAKVRYIVLNRSLEDKIKSCKTEEEITLVKKHEESFNSQLRDILNGDGLDVEVIDCRQK